MSKPILLTAAALAAFAMAAAVRAEPLSGSQIQARAAGGEFRGDTYSLRGFESHIWRLARDGQARAVAIVRRAPGNFFHSHTEFSDAGTWRVQGNSLCVEWAGPNRQFSGCYTVDLRQGDHVRIVGPATWEGTLSR